MLDEKRRVCVSIGVSDASPLPYLAAVLNCAAEFHLWASASGYSSTLVTDKDAAVTVETLRSAFTPILADTTPIDRLIVYFAGHGMIREAENGLWFLSDTMSTGHVVAYEALRRRLLSYNIRQISLFSDACRVLPTSMEHINLEETGVLNPGKSPGITDVDKFVATRDGKPTYALPAGAVQDDVCIFSGVLIEALHGEHGTAFSKVTPEHVTSQSLSRFLRDEVPRKASLYGLSVQPTVAPGFLDCEDIYYSNGSPLNRKPGITWPVFPAAPPLPLAPVAASERDSSSTKRSTISFNAPDRRHDRYWDFPPSLEMKQGFRLFSRVSPKVHVPLGVRVEQVGNGWYGISSEGTPRDGKVNMCITLEIGDLFVPLVILGELLLEVYLDKQGVSSLRYRNSYRIPQSNYGELVMQLLDKGNIPPVALVDIAAELRYSKHGNPALGVLAAYLYESIGDRDSIRQLAYFYTARNQPIPFDIAFLADLSGRQVNGQLFVAVPAVAKREPRTAMEEDLQWTHDSTPAETGKVAGRWPWLRQGWAFLDEPTDPEATLIRPRLTELARHLMPARFTTFNRKGGKLFTELFLLEPNETK